MMRQRLLVMTKKNKPHRLSILSAYSIWVIGLIAFLCGIGLTLAQPPLYFWPLLFLVFPLFASCIRQVTTFLQAFGIGWCAGVGFFLTGLFWVGEAFLVTPEQHAWMLPFVIIFLPGGMAIFWGGMTTAVWATCRFLARYIQTKAAMRIYFILFLAVFWVITEYVRSTIFTGFAWALLSYSWLETPVSQGLSLFGAYTLGGLSVLIFGLTGYGLQGLIKRTIAIYQKKPRLKKKVAVSYSVCVVLGTGVLGALYAYGYWYVQQPPVVEDAQTRVRLIQPNVKQKMQLTQQDRDEIMRKLLSATHAKAGETPDIIIWPESAVPYLINNNTPEMAVIRQQIASVLPGESYLITGILRQHFTASDNETEFRNSIAVLDKSARITALYDKHHLVPFGEYLPFKKVLSFLGFEHLVDVVGGFTPGEGTTIMRTQGIPDFLPLICYEAIFPMEVNSLPVRPRWIVHLTNDAWFGDTSGPLQHLAQAQARAIEQGLPVMRVANTGISAVIDSHGAIWSYLPLNSYGKIDSVLPPALPPTFYTRFGEVGSIILILGIVLFSGGHCFFKKRSSKVS